MITVDIPRNTDDAEFLVDCASDYAQEALRNTGLLHHGTLLSEDMLTLVIRKRRRKIGIVSTVTGVNEDGAPRTEIDVRYFLPRWRDKGHTRPLLEAITSISPAPLYLRGPVTLADREAAAALSIDHHEGELPEMQTITNLVLANIDCEDYDDGPCPGCIRTTMREHFTQQCSKMIVKAFAYQGITP